jgi:hypothetical protein
VSKADVRSDALTVRVIAALNYDFEIGGVLLLAILFFEEFSGKSEMLDGFNNATPVGNFAWHVIVYTTHLKLQRRKNCISHKKAPEAHEQI